MQKQTYHLRVTKTQITSYHKTSILQVILVNLVFLHKGPCTASGTGEPAAIRPRLYLSFQSTLSPVNDHDRIAVTRKPFVSGIFVYGESGSQCPSARAA